MLVHKRTMGVLAEIWEGYYTREADGSLLPVCRRVKLSDVDNPEEWWEVPSRGALASKILWNYPFLRPVVDENGALVDVICVASEYEQEEARRAQEARQVKTQEANRRGYQRNFNKLRPTGLIPLLWCTQTCNNG